MYVCKKWVYFHSSFQAIPEFIPADHSWNSFRIQYNRQDLDQVVEWVLLKDLSIYAVSDLWRWNVYFSLNGQF